MRHSFLAVTILLSSTLAALAQGAADASSKLPPGDGRDLVLKNCSKCHTPEIVMGQGFDAKGWQGVIDQMVTNGADASDEDFAKIVAYLAKSFPG